MCVMLIWILKWLTDNSLVRTILSVGDGSSGRVIGPRQPATRSVTLVQKKCWPHSPLPTNLSVVTLPSSYWFLLFILALSLWICFIMSDDKITAFGGRISVDRPDFYCTPTESYGVLGWIETGIMILAGIAGVISLFPVAGTSTMAQTLVKARLGMGTWVASPINDFFSLSLSLTLIFNW